MKNYPVTFDPENLPKDSLIVLAKDGRPAMPSLIFSEKVQVSHSNVFCNVSILALAAQEHFDVFFEETTYIDAKGKRQPLILIFYAGFNPLVGLYKEKLGVELLQEFNNEFMETMEFIAKKIYAKVVNLDKKFDQLEKELLAKAGA